MTGPGQGRCAPRGQSLLRSQARCALLPAPSPREGPTRQLCLAKGIVAQGAVHRARSETTREQGEAATAAVGSGTAGWLTTAAVAASPGTRAVSLRARRTDR